MSGLPVPPVLDATLEVLGSNTFTVTPPKPSHPRRRGRATAYVVFEGLAPGVYETWQEFDHTTLLSCSLAVQNLGKMLNRLFVVFQETFIKDSTHVTRPY